MKRRRCPFCGGQGVFVYDWGTGRRMLAWIECETCNARGPVLDLDPERYSPASAAILAFKAWQERAKP